MQKIYVSRTRQESLKLFGDGNSQEPLPVAKNSVSLVLVFSFEHYLYGPLRLLTNGYEHNISSYEALSNWYEHYISTYKALTNGYEHNISSDEALTHRYEHNISSDEALK